ncbi:hypothetical protein ACEXQE_14600 [Herbiconiux sp. P17]|uniref:hypothetical protein n=1 Tax=Herbiconiux wuyangfengii TaxID=3342794 RepID=UPI0035B6CA80
MSTESVVIALVGAHVYSDGVELLIDRRLRRGRMPAAEWSRVQAEFTGHWAPSPSADRLRWGIALGDGQQVVLDGMRNGLDGDAPAGHSLMLTGGGGGGDTSFYRMADGLWLWPLPPEGPLEIVLQWPALGIPESRVLLNATAIRALAPAARPLWQ